MATLALKTIAKSQARRGTAVIIDMSRTFDPGYAQRCGVYLHRLMIVHPYNAQQANTMLPDLAAGDGLDLLVFDMPLHTALALQL